ncbi:MAG TPA: DUF4406 domain-containing protein [Candidatus Paceibacterota bacterium]|nr:DUF4406 domain-containing protein [Candidatus Paceibacterota bacterium]
MELSNITKKYFNKEDWQDLEKAQSVKELYIVANRIINRIPEPRIQVCGPISTGGKGSIEKNMEVFNEKIKELQEKGFNVFDQMPFEDPMHRIILNSKKEEYMESILTDFYLPIFESRYVSELHFLPDWQSSRGANWEHEQAKRLGIKINYI